MFFGTPCNNIFLKKVFIIKQPFKVLNKSIKHLSDLFKTNWKKIIKTFLFIDIILNIDDFFHCAMERMETSKNGNAPKKGLIKLI